MKSGWVGGGNAVLVGVQIASVVLLQYFTLCCY
jgi:hypothetical protein